MATDAEWTLGVPVRTERSGEGLRHVARNLEALAGLLDRRPLPRCPNGVNGPASGPSDEFLAEIAKGILRTRASRAKFLPAELFSEHAWDMLLDLFIQRTVGGTVSVTSALIAGGGAPTTCLRWLAVLDQLGLVRRAPAATDRRVVLVELTDAGHAAIRGVLSHWIGELAGGVER